MFLNSPSSNSRSSRSSISLGLAFSLIAGLGAPFILSTILQTKAQAQTIQNQTIQNQSVQIQTSQAHLAQAQPAQAQPNTFTDVSSDYWAHDYIEGLTRLNIISGFPDGTFKPNERVTRAEFAAILRRAFLQSQPTAAQPFTDIPPNYWATEAIYAARAAGFLSGYPGNTFEPDSPIRRDETLISLTNGLKYTGGSLETLARYSDAEYISSYAQPIIAAATAANLVVNYPNADQVMPYRLASRAEVAAFVYQALVKEGRATPLSAKADSWQREPVATIPVEAEKMSFSSSGQQIVTLASQGTRIQVWNAPTGALVRDIAVNGMIQVDAIAISPDGKQIAAVSKTTPSQTVTATAWSVETGEQLWSKPLGTAQTELSDGTPSVSFAQITFSPSGTQIMTQVNLGTSATRRPTDGQLRLHSATTGEVVQSLDYAADGNAELLQFAFSPDGMFLATASHLRGDLEPTFAEHRVNLWRRNLDNGFDSFQTIQLTGLSEGDFTFIDMVFTNSGLLNFLRQALYETRLDTWSLNTGQFYGRTALPDADRTDLLTRLSPDGEYYFIRGDVAGSRLGNVQTRAVQKLDSIDTVAAFSGNGDYLALGNGQAVRIFSKAAP